MPMSTAGVIHQRVHLVLNTPVMITSPHTVLCPRNAMSLSKLREVHGLELQQPKRFTSNTLTRTHAVVPHLVPIGKRSRDLYDPCTVFVVDRRGHTKRASTATLSTLVSSTTVCLLLPHRLIPKIQRRTAHRKSCHGLNLPVKFRMNAIIWRAENRNPRNCEKGGREADCPCPRLHRRSTTGVSFNSGGCDGCMLLYRGRGAAKDDALWRSVSQSLSLLFTSSDSLCLCGHCSVSLRSQRQVALFRKVHSAASALSLQFTNTHPLLFTA